MDTDPIPRSHRDRRTTPRRAEDVALHYASLGLLAAALAVADDVSAYRAAGLTPLNSLVDAAAVYRVADAAAHDNG